MKSTLVLLGMLFCLTGSAYADDLARFAGDFTLVAGDNDCPGSLSVANTSDANKLAFGIIRAAKIEIPARYKANAIISENRIRQFIYNDTRPMSFGLVLQDPGVHMQISVGHWESAGMTHDRYRFVKDYQMQCQYQRQ